MSFTPPVQADQVVPEWQTYLDVTADVMPYLQIDATNTADQVKLQLFCDMACQWVQNYLGQPIAPTTFFRRFSGYTGMNGAYIQLPYSPVLQILEINEWWGLNGKQELVYQTPANQGGADQEMYQVDWVTGTLIRSYQGLVQRPFFPGSLNIEITWQAGYNPVRADVRVATLELLAYWWRSVQEAPRWFGQATYDDAGMSKLWPAVPNRITQLLQPYVQVGIA